MAGNRKDYNKAISDLSEAIKLDPTDEFAYYDRGRPWLEKETFDKADRRLRPSHAGARPEVI